MNDYFSTLLVPESLVIAAGPKGPHEGICLQVRCRCICKTATFLDNLPKRDLAKAGTVRHRIQVSLPISRPGRASTAS